jgi:hypothetical protein
MDRGSSIECWEGGYNFSIRIGIGVYKNSNSTHR